MSGSMKQRALMATMVMVLLYAALAGIWFFSAQTTWKRSAKAYNKAKTEYARECALIRKRDSLKQDYEDAKALMPMFEAGKATDTTWQRKLDAIAERNLIVISQKQAGREEVVGDVTVLSIDVKSWEGCLEALVKFLHELENTEEGMFDISALNFKPSSKKGYLKGSLTLTCAYMREK